MLNEGFNRIGKMFTKDGVLYYFIGDELNIIYVETSKYLTLMFDLEYISKEKADKIVDVLGDKLSFNKIECISNRLSEYNLECDFPNTVTDESVITTIFNVFQIEL